MSQTKSQIAQIFRTPDGVIHATLAEANEHLGKPKVIEALTAIASGKVNVATWLLSVKEQLLSIFDIGVVRRVTKVEQKALQKDIDALKLAAAEAKEKGIPFMYPFLAEHADSVAGSFHHPKVTRLTTDERANSIANSLTALTEGDKELADWINVNHTAILEAYKAGVVKRTPAPQAMAALKEYQEKEKARKAALAAAAAAGTLALPETTGETVTDTVLFAEDECPDGFPVGEEDEDGVEVEQEDPDALETDVEIEEKVEG